MARTSIEEDTFGKISKFAGRLGWSEREAMGLLTLLWHDSQDEEISLATKEEIFDFCRLYSETPDEKEMILNALLKSKFVVSKENGLFEIRGNAKQIKILRAYRDRTKKATEARAEKIVSPKNIQNVDSASQKHNVDVTSTLHPRERNENVNVQLSYAKLGYNNINKGDPVFPSSKEFRASLPIHLVEQGQVVFGEEFENEAIRCFEFHSVNDAKDLPATIGKWHQKWLTWLENERKSKKRAKGRGKAENAWLAKAEQIQAACRKVSSYSENSHQQLVEILGEELVKLVYKSGGFGRVRQMPDNDFTTKRLAGDLKSAFEEMGNTGGAA